MAPSRKILVDSLYGPGTVGAWLLTLCAVFISWTLNKFSRRKDSISLDFVLALLLPLVAAGHLVFQVLRLPYSVFETITSAEVEVQQYASALEAPLNICETFSIAALISAACCGPWWQTDPKLKRLGALLLVGLISWGTQNLMFAVATLRGVKASDVTLSRPYLFLVTPIVAMTWGFLGLCVLIGSVVCITGKINIRRGARKSEADLEMTRRLWSRRYQSAVSRMDGSGAGSTRKQMAGLNAAELELARYETRVMLLLGLTSMLFTPLALMASFYSMALSYSETKEYSAQDPRRRWIFLIPESDSSMSSLDQILALIGGILVLLRAIGAAYSSRKGGVDELQSRSRRRRSI